MAQNKGNFTCVSCGQSFDSQQELRDHEDSRHAGERSSQGGGADRGTTGGAGGGGRGSEGWQGGERNPERNV